MQMDWRPGLAWPLLLLAAGGLWLLHQANLLPPGGWPALARLWPVLLVLIGLDLLLGRRTNRRVALVLLLCGLLVAAALLILMPLGG